MDSSTLPLFIYLSYTILKEETSPGTDEILPTDSDIILTTIAQQYKIKKDRLYQMKLASVVKEEVERLDRERPGWSATDFPWDLILDGNEKLRPELLEPSS